MANTSFSDYTEQGILKHHFRNTAMAVPPTALYIALFLVLPSEDGTGGIEVSTVGTAYARIAVTTGTSGSGVGSGWTITANQAANNADLLWAPATASWGTIVGVALFDAASSGNMFYLGAFDSAVPIALNDTFKFSAGNLTVTLD